MPLTHANWNPEIDVDGTTKFNFTANGIDLSQRPGVDSDERLNETRVPGSDGGNSYSAGLNPSEIQFAWRIYSTDPEVVIPRIIALRTALRGRAVGTTGWPAGKFKFYLHRDDLTGVYLYWQRCVCDRFRFELATGKYYTKEKKAYTEGSFVIKAEDPTWYTSAEGGAPTEEIIIEFEDLLLVRYPATLGAAIVVEDNESGDAVIALRADGDLDLVGQLKELQETIGT